MCQIYHDPTAVPCDRIVITGATVAHTGQLNKMGTYTKVAGQLNDGKPVFQRGSQYLYHHASNNKWYIGPTVGSNSVWMSVISSAASPELIDASSTWYVLDGSNDHQPFQPDAGGTASCASPTRWYPLWGTARAASRGAPEAV